MTIVVLSTVTPVYEPLKKVGNMPASATLARQALKVSVAERTPLR
jgi:hypothetical protein